MHRCALILLAGLAGLSFASGRDYPAHVVRAVDGDTIICDIDLGLGVEIKLQRVRLAAIDAPEKDKPGWKEARDFVVTSVGNKDVILHTVGKLERDKYGRVLARVEIDGKDLGATLLASKLVAVFGAEK